MIIGMKTLALTGLDTIMNPELARQAKQELNEYRSKNFKHPYPTGEYPDYLA